MFRIIFITLFVLTNFVLTTSVQAAEFTATVTRVIDGDSIKFKSEALDVTISGTCRMQNYNAPEIHGKEKPEGLKAKQKLEELIKDKQIKIIASKKDKYGRWLCESPDIDAVMREYLKDYSERDKYVRPRSKQ